MLKEQGGDGSDKVESVVMASDHRWQMAGVVVVDKAVILVVASTAN